MISVPKTMLDEFLHLTGETTVIRNMVNKLVRAIERRIPGDEDVELLVELLEEMHKINAGMQTKTAELRKTPITQALKKLPRTMRDVCAQLGKKVKLTVTGDTLRVDTAIVQALSNSLIHMIRNSVDHGIEMPERRLALGKPAEGSIVLACREVKDFVVVELRDDGGGIDPERIRTKLRENGQLEAAVIEAMGREQLLRQIFEPGFSTAKAVTDVSGRGVGMDMVRTSIEDLKGRIDISSEVGRGTTFKFTIPIPKSVVIINALIVGVGARYFAVPQDNIVRLLRITPDRRQTDVADLPGGATLRGDGSLLPLVFLSEVLQLEDAAGGQAGDLNVLVLRWDGGSYALVVDAIHGAEDVVVKSLHGCVERLGVFAGSTFLDDGSVGLILDVGGVAVRAGHVERIEQRRDADPSPTVEPRGGEGAEIMLFELVEKHSFALPLECVFRIEELSRELVVEVGERRVVRHREELLPVLDLAGALGLQGGDRAGGEASDKLGMLIVSEADQRFAVPIVRVVEICRAESEVLPAAQAMPGVRGLTTVDGHIVTVVDLAAAVRTCGYASAASIAKREERPIEVKATEVPPEPAAAAGWGLF
jgi:two-component system chemotaxis sensor kinase CheA